jgi:hypothetical protein
MRVAPSRSVQGLKCRKPTHNQKAAGLRPWDPSWPRGSPTPVLFPANVSG